MSEKTPHDEYWGRVAERAEARLQGIFHNAMRSIEDLVADGNGLDDREDLEEVLAYVYRHGDCHDRSRATLASFELLQAWHELSEHKGGTP